LLLSSVPHFQMVYSLPEHYGFVSWSGGETCTQSPLLWRCVADRPDDVGDDVTQFSHTSQWGAMATIMLQYGTFV
jgi:hypothetical protein